MSATREIRDLAATFGWDAHTDDSRRQDTFLHGQHMISVDYCRDGSVRDASRYEFASIMNPKFREATRGRDKKGDVESWLIKLGD